MMCGSPLDPNASMTFRVFREARWTEDGGRLFAVRVVEESVAAVAGGVKGERPLFFFFFFKNKIIITPEPVIFCLFFAP